MRLRNLLFILILITALTGCSFQPKKFEPLDLSNHLIEKDMCFVDDNVFIILDTSGSMGMLHFDNDKLSKSLNFLDNLNETLHKIPGIKNNFTIITFGKQLWSKESSVSFHRTKDKRYNYFEIKNILRSIDFANGKTLLHEAIQKTTKVIRSKKNQSTIIILLSDGEEKTQESLIAVKEMKKQLDKNVKIYTILVGNSLQGRAKLRQMSHIGNGFFEKIDNLSENQRVAKYLERIFFTKKCTSKKQTTENLDKQTLNENYKGIDKNSEVLIMKSEKMSEPTKSLDNLNVQHEKSKINITDSSTDIDIAPDSDGDGISDKNDNCNDTPKGAKIDKNGCWKINNIYYQYKESIFGNEYNEYLNEISEIMKKNPELRLTVIGHTDSVGSEFYNKRLSEKRSRVVVKYFLYKGIERSRLLYKGFGELKPVLPNDTEMGRKENRRVEFKISTVPLQ